MKSIKRISAVLFALAMIVTMLPIFSLTASAAGTLTVSDTGIGLSWTDASSSSGKATWTASGTTITGTATGYKSIGIISRTVTTKLTIKNNYADARTLSFSYTLSGGGSVSGISGNAYSGELAAGGTLVITLTSPSGTSTNTLTITDIKLVGSGNVTTTFAAPENGSYTVDGTAVTNEVSYTKASADSSYTLAATANSGYTFFGWYNETAGTYVSYDASCTLTVGSDATVKPVFIPSNSALFGVDDAKFFDLTEACNVAAGSTKKVVVLNNGTVTGTHTIPAGVTLLVPYDDANTAYGTATPSGLLAKRSPACTSTSGNNVAWVKPTAYRTLTMAADAHITVNGAIEVGGRHAAGSGGTGMYGGSPTDKLGYINMLAGSHIDLNSGAYLYCWGYIYGDGTITAKNGAAIYENFQIQDFRGGDKSTNLAEGGLVFPTAQYYVQNIEVATRYEYGSTEYVLTSIYMSAMCHSATVQFIGSNAMFQPAVGSYVVKDYDPATDNLYLDSYGDCALSELTMNLAGVNVNSAQFVLPITNNMQIRIRTGTATLQQNVMMLPGSSLTVDQGATLNLAYTDATTDVVAGGYILQMFDYSNYISGIDMDTFEVVANRYYNHYGSTGKRRFQAVPYTCTTRKTRTEADLVDAKLDINGTVISNGFILSTVDYADVASEDYTITGGGANICSSEGTGVIQMVNGAGVDVVTGDNVFGVMYDQDCAEAVDKGGKAGDGVFYYIPLASAQLKNGDGTMLDTTGAEAGTTYQVCPTHDCWYTGECEACSDPCAGGHSYEGVQTTAPTCTTTGVKTYTCSVCGDSYTETIPAKGHTPGAEADCENAQTCTVCGAVLNAALGHSWTDATCTAPKTCSVCGETEGEALGHSYNAVETPADCENDGSIVYTCSVCGDSYTETIPAKGHTPGAEADCENAQTCTVCGEVLNAALGHSWVAADCDTPKTCSVCGETEGEALGHSYEGVQTTAPTCTTAGVKTYTCSVCGDSYTESIAALGHTPGAAADCENAQTCTVCGAVLNAALGHSWVDADCDTPKTCSVCGETEGEALGHNWVDADCDTPKTCSVCGETEGEALGHNWVDADCDTPKTCSVCGETEGEALGHSWTDATCTDPKTCSVCGETEGEALGHNWTDATCTAPKTCSVCGETEGEALGHTYAHDFDVDCNVCGAVRAVVGPISYVGKSISEDVSGLAFLFNVAADGIVVKEGTFVQADFTNATYNGYKLLGVGAIASNGTSSTNIEGLRMYDLEEGNAKFAFRVINIPANKLDVEVTMTPYYVVEIDGVATTIYGEAQTSSYNQTIPAE